MGKKKKGKKKRAKKGGQQRSKHQAESKHAKQLDRRTVLTNYLENSMPGCYVAHFEHASSSSSSSAASSSSSPPPSQFSDWVISSEAFDREDFGLGPSDPVPDLSIDPDEHVLTVINDHGTNHKAYYISIRGTNFQVLDRRGRHLAIGHHREESNTKPPKSPSPSPPSPSPPSPSPPPSLSSSSPCLTLILSLPPLFVVDVCHLRLPRGAAPQDLDIASDISVLENRVAAGETKREGEARILGFPLAGNGPYLCSQGNDGKFTHFYPATRHAVDFECPVGTPVLAVADGTVADVQDHNNAGGIHVSALYKWNSISLELEDGCLVDYVHIREQSSSVKVGDRVRKGQILCETGDVGFCPRPHLHLQLTQSKAKDAPTVPFVLNCDHGEERVTPVAGRWYSRKGEHSLSSAPDPFEWSFKMEVLSCLARHWSRMMTLNDDANKKETEQMQFRYEALEILAQYLS